MRFSTGPFAICFLLMYYSGVPAADTEKSHQSTMLMPDNDFLISF